MTRCSPNIDLSIFFRGVSDKIGVLDWLAAGKRPTLTRDVKSIDLKHPIKFSVPPLRPGTAIEMRL